MRERRETLGLSLDDVERAIRIRVQYLIALETDDWQYLPGEVVGRGFLHNYADFLKLNAEELKQRRQATVVEHLTDQWTTTSAGAPMPTPRHMDYRPLEVQMTGESFATGSGPGRAARRRVRRVLAPLAGAGLLVLALWWSLGFPDLPELQAIQRGIVARSQEMAATVTRTLTLRPRTGGAQPESVPIIAVEVPLPATATATTIPVSTPTAATAATGNGITIPTLTPTAVPPLASSLSPAACSERVRITSPLEGQVVSGDLPITGTADHDNFWYYKMERAEGTDAESVFLYFEGIQNTVIDGILGTLDTGFMANGPHTIRLTVVDRANAEPAICDVHVTVQN